MKKPVLKVKSTGSSLKILEITGEQGAVMPEHHSSEEVSIVVQKGRALLTIGGENKVLSEGHPFIIPAGASHALEVQQNFLAYGVTPKTGEIAFE